MISTVAAQSHAIAAEDRSQRTITLKPTFESLEMQLAFWQAAVEKDPGEYGNWTQLAETYVQQGQPQRAIEAANKASEIDPNRFEAYFHFSDDTLNAFYGRVMLDYFDPLA